MLEVKIWLRIYGKNEVWRQKIPFQSPGKKQDWSQMCFKVVVEGKGGWGLCVRRSGIWDGTMDTTLEIQGS